MKHEPVGQCIYCGNTDGSLTDEHIIPFAFGGNEVLPKASCESCRIITARIENDCMRRMFGPARIKLGVQTRRPKERPTTLPIDFEFKYSRETIEVPIEDHPFQIALPVPGPAKALRGLPETTDGRMDVRLWYYPAQPNVDALLRRYGATGCKLDYFTFEPLTFVRFLAKMAHGFFWIHHRTHAVPLASRLILGQSNDPNFLVGGQKYASFDPIDRANTIFQITSVRHKEHGNVVVIMRFFPTLPQSPIYHVLVGIRAGSNLVAFFH